MWDWLPATVTGRLLNVVGTGPDVATARTRAHAAERIRIRGSHFRADIAAKA